MSGRPIVPANPFLYSIVDASFVGNRSLSEWVGLLAGPDRAQVVQWRFKSLADDAALEGARQMRDACREAGALFIVNDRPDVARIVEADGVHVGQGDLHPDEVRGVLKDAVIGVSTHNKEQFEAALRSSADYIAVGPVFETSAKANPDPVVGRDFVAWAARRTSRPIVAIGGITAARARSVVESGARGLAVISDLMKAERPDASARAFRDAMR